MLDGHEWQKAYKMASSKAGNRGSTTAMFYAVVSAYCLIHLKKPNDALDQLSDFKTQKPKDTPTA